MTSMLVPHHRSPQIAHQRPGDHAGKGGAHHDAALLLIAGDGLKINPTDNSDDLVANLDADAFAKDAAYRDRLSHSDGVGHFTSDPFAGAAA